MYFLVRFSAAIKASAGKLWGARQEILVLLLLNWVVDVSVFLFFYSVGFFVFLCCLFFECVAGFCWVFAGVVWFVCGLDLCFCFFGGLCLVLFYFFW